MRCGSAGNDKITVMYKVEQKAKRISEKGIGEAKNVIDNKFSALFRGRPQEISPYRAWSNHPFDGWL